MKLKEYRIKRGLEKADMMRELDAEAKKMGADVKISYLNVWRWDNEEVKPSDAAIKVIKSWSCGAVSADDFLGV